MGLVKRDELFEPIDAEVAERHGAIVVGPVDPDQAVFWLHVDRDTVEPVLVFAEVGRDAGDGGNVMDLVELHAYAALAA